MNNRQLSGQFMTKMLQGVLRPVRQAIAEDDTLMPGLRGDRLDIYYRGGVLISLRDASEDYVIASYDQNYARYESSGHVELIKEIGTEADANLLVDQIYALKRQIDRHRFNVPKNEREAQQLIARENNLSTVAHETDYFIVDIEVADSSLGARFDMAAVRWKKSKKGGDPVMVPVLIEVKHGIAALQGSAGLAKHLQDLRAAVATPSWRTYLADLEKQLEQLADLGAMTWNKSAAKPRMTIDLDATPEVLFILANYNPASTQLLAFLDQTPDSVAPADIDLRFAISCFAGYGLYKASMFKRSDFRKLVNDLLPIAKRQALAPVSTAASESLSDPTYHSTGNDIQPVEIMDTSDQGRCTTAS